MKTNHILNQGFVKDESFIYIHKNIGFLDEKTKLVAKSRPCFCSNMQENLKGEIIDENLEDFITWDNGIVWYQDLN